MSSAHANHWGLIHTDNHDIEVETLADTLAVPLVGQVGKTNIAGKLAADDVLHIGSGLGHGLGIAGADRLGGSGDGVAALHERRLLTTGSGGGRFVAGRDGGTVRRRRSYAIHQSSSSGDVGRDSPMFGHEFDPRKSLHMAKVLFWEVRRTSNDGTKRIPETRSDN